MNLNAKAIETLSVNAVKDSIVMSDLLEPFITDNDKEPSWDGNVYIYECKNHKKENLKGRLSVQIKGKESYDFSQEEISYSMSTVDLKNYLYDGGVILFVVYIGSGGIQRKIYFIELPPIKLRLTLANAKDQKTKTLTLKEFPHDNNKKATIFLNCLQNCQKQSSFTDAKLLSLDELEKQGLLEGITIPISAVGINDFQRALVTNEVYVYANIRGSAIPQPLELIPQNMVTKQEQNSTISVGDNIYYTKVQIVKMAEETSLIIGDSVTISIVEKDMFWKIIYKESKKVRILARDLDFMISCIEYGYFCIDDTKLYIDKDTVDFSNFNVDEQKEMLMFAKKVVDALDMLNCKEDVDLHTLTNEEKRNLKCLIIAFVDKKVVENLLPDLPPIIKLGVGALSFVLCLQACEKGKTSYKIYDFFKTEMSFAYDGKNEEKLPISQYSILHADDFLTVNNIRYDVLLPSFQNIKKHYDKYNRANWFLLDLLIAFDKSNGKREEILKVSHDFADWIMREASEDELPFHVKMLNCLQVIKREREFNASELAELYSLVESSTAREDLLVGAYLLLGQQKAAEIHFNKLTSDQQNSFKSYPIYRFWIETGDKDNG